MGLEVARRDFADRSRALVFWTLGILLYVGFIVAFYPTVRDQADRFNEMVASYPKAMLDLFSAGESFDFGSPSGFLNTYLFAFMIPVTLFVLTIGYGAAAIAGEEADGRLELLLGYPVTRRTVVVQKALVLLAELVVIGIAVVALLGLTTPLVRLDVPLGNLVVATVGMVLVALDMGLVALAVGAATGRKGAAAGVAAALAAAMYLVSTLAPSLPWLQPARYASLFYWGTSGSPLANGLPAGHLVVLVAVAAAAVAAGAAGFARRDLRG